jgi:arginine exporter protein ArgO
MRRLALVAGALFLLAAIAGFAGMIATLPMYNAVLAVAGVLFILFGVTNRRSIIEPRGPGRDLRDLGGA